MAALAVSAIGLATSMGGAVQSCAAARAGLTRVAPAPDVSVMSPGDESPQPVLAHAHATATQGFCGAGRLIALLAEALEDLLAQVPASALSDRARLFVALPDPAERDPDAMGVSDGDDTAEARVAALGKIVVEGVARATGLPLLGLSPTFHGGGELAFAMALGAAHRAIAAQEAQAALVCAVDSFVSQDTIDLFAEDGRVKSGERPSGFIPGEAAGAVLLVAPPRGASTVLLGGPVLGEDAWRFGADVPSDGRALARCMSSAAGPPGGRPSVVLLSDMDGEQHRARELAVAQVHLAGVDRPLAQAEVQYPAIAFGRTGAASGLVAAATARHLLWRVPASARRFVVVSSADDGGRSAFTISRSSP